MSCHAKNDPVSLRGDTDFDGIHEPADEIEPLSLEGSFIQGDGRDLGWGDFFAPIMDGHAEDRINGVDLNTDRADGIRIRVIAGIRERLPRGQLDL